MLVKVLFKNVKWDTDGESLNSCGLKKNFEAEVDMEDINFQSTDDEIEEKLSDWLSDEYGYCHAGFDYQILPEKVITKKAEIKKFFDKAINDMKDREDDTVWTIRFTPNINILLKWEDGYDPAENTKYIKNGWGINVSLVERDSSYFTADWRQLNDSTTMSDNYDNIINWLESCLKHAF